MQRRKLSLFEFEPPPRWGHFSAPINGYLYVWGGRTENFSSAEQNEAQSTLYILDPYLESWEKKIFDGSHHPGVYSGACASTGQNLYLFGGHDGDICRSSLYQFNTKTLKWTELVADEGPMGKTGCRMIIFDGKLLIFGGYGIPSGPTQPESEFIENNRFTDGRGWTNELHSFNLKEGEV